MISVTLDGDTALMKKLEQSPEKWIAAFLKVSAEESEALAEEIRANASGGVLQARTGTLAESVQPDAPKTTGLTAEVGVSSDVFYGVIQETGIANPYPEEAQGKAMVFEDAGNTVFAKMVEHPALPEHPWFTPVLDAHAPQIVEDVQAAIREELQKP